MQKKKIKFVGKGVERFNQDKFYMYEGEWYAEPDTPQRGEQRVKVSKGEYSCRNIPLNFIEYLD